MNGSNSTRTIPQTLENTLARAVSSVTGIIEFNELESASPERLAELVQLAQLLETKTERLAGEIIQAERATAADIEEDTAAVKAAGNGADPAEATRENIRAIRETAEPGSPAAELADGLERELEGDDSIDVLGTVELATAELDSLHDVMSAALFQVEGPQPDGVQWLGCLYVADREMKRIRANLDGLARKLANNRAQFQCVKVQPKGGAA